MSELLVSYDPASGSRLGEVELTDADALDQAVRASQHVFDGQWSRDAALRTDAMFAWAGAIEKAAGELSEILMHETGKVRAETQREISLSLDALRFNAGIARVVQGSAGWLPDGSVAHLVRQPRGVSAFIVPWNWPVFLLLRDLAPGLAAGVTAVIKSAPQTPLSTRMVLDLSRGTGMPDGVLASVFGGREVGRALVEHPLIRTVSFTGSTQAGRLVMRAATNDFTHVLLELGGKGASLVFADADLDAVVDASVQNGFITSGQMCMANSRVLVERDVFAQVRDAICERVERLRTGPPQDPASDLGPLISEEHLERVMAYIDLGRHRIVAGGQRLGGDLASGCYLSPTVLAGDGLDERILREEIFGPVVTVEPFRSEAEALRLANASPYGLATAVWTSDVDRAWRVAKGVDAGTVWVNRYNRMFAEIPSGGMKHSGIGRTRGLEGVHEFTELKHINWAVGPAPPVARPEIGRDA